MTRRVPNPMPPKDRARRALRVRWGAPRRFNLGDLSDEQRITIANLVEAFRHLNATQSGQGDR